MVKFVLINLPTKSELRVKMMTKVLIIGASGMIGRAMHNAMFAAPQYEVYSTGRRNLGAAELSQRRPFIITGDLTKEETLEGLLQKTCPDVVINCAGLTKHVPEVENQLKAIETNAVLPHRLAQIGSKMGFRLIHISTDCVFDGSGGNYEEGHPTDAIDVYGKSKALGEVFSSEHVTLRTSTIGHELETEYGLLEWFLRQTSCEGYCNAIFSGLTTNELARIVRDCVIPRADLVGLYNVGGERIDKFSLLTSINKIYSVNAEIVANSDVKVDRSLNSLRFYNAVGRKIKSWDEMITDMYNQHKKSWDNV